MDECHTEEGTCRWTWVHDTLGQYHYETDCGKDVFTERPVNDDAPPCCFGCRRHVEVVA